jgi:hypothetical protein
MITRELCLYFSRRNGLLISLYISLTVSAVLAVNALLGMQGRSLIPYAPTSMWMGILFAMWAVGSWQGIQAERAERQASAGFDDRLPWER